MHRRALALFLVLIAITSVMALVGARGLAFSMPSGMAPNELQQYDPVLKGLPKTIDGYTVLAVLTSQTTACMKPGEKNIILQGTDRNVPFPPKPGQAASIKKEPQQYGFGVGRLDIGVPGPTTTPKGIFEEKA